MSAAYHLLVADIARTCDHDLRTILAAAEASRETFRTEWHQHDLRHLVLTHDDADMVWDGFVGFLGRYVAHGEPIHPLIISPGALAMLRLSCADGLPLLRAYQDQEPQVFPEIAEEMAVMSALYHAARLRDEMAAHYTRLHYIADTKDSDEMQTRIGAVLLAFGSLASFVVGSYAAMGGLTGLPEPAPKIQSIP